ncbi:MAG: hypothetical protein H0U74_10590 [Bradymonadaceae bacterium]|nr:hypothetical protein [Lujinxingiaceae bacterium]
MAGSGDSGSKGPSSTRQKKKLVDEGVRALRNKPGWDPASFSSTSPEEKLLILDQQSAGEKAYAEADVCAQCLALRQEKGDETLLCAPHLAEAMGF